MEELQDLEVGFIIINITTLSPEIIIALREAKEKKVLDSSRSILKQLLGARTVQSYKVDCLIIF